MGYYSDVRFNTNKKGYKLLLDRLSDNTKECLFYDNGKPPVYDEEGDSIVFGWDNIKWYDWFPEVNGVMSAFHKLYDEGVPFEYFRVGEETGDTECYDEYLSCNYQCVLTRHLEIVTRIDVWK